jgi:phosphoesterase RecJ-like protein
VAKTTNWDDAERAVLTAETILIVSHLSPDGDAVGSLLGIANALRALGKTIVSALDDSVPDILRFLPNSDTVQTTLTDGDWDLMISVDSSDEERTGKCGAYGRLHSKTVINIDHHATNVMFGNIHLVDPTAVSATEVIFQLLKTMNFKFSPEVATPLLTGLVTDTLGFRTNNVKPDTLLIAHELMGYGASLTEITARTLGNKSFLAVNLWKYALATVQLHEGGVISAEITEESLKRAGLNDLTDSGLVGFLVKVNEAMISVVFKETIDGRIEISLRSKPGFDVSAVALSLGGGGHQQASGATIDGPMESAKKRVLPLLRNCAKEGNLVIA